MPETMPSAQADRTKRESPRWAQLAASDIGVSAATVESMMSGPKPIHERLFAVIRRQIECGDVELTAKVEPGLQAALAGLPIPELTSELILWAVEADEEEAIDRERYILNPTPENRRKWRISLETQRARGYVLLLAVQKADRLG